MRNFTEIYKELDKLLPAVINEIQDLESQIVFKCTNFVFIFDAPWRVIKNGVFKYGQWTQGASSLLKDFEGSSVEKVTVQSQQINCDLSLITSKGFCLEVFSMDSLEPWSLHIKENTYYACPSDENWAI